MDCAANDSTNAVISQSSGHDYNGANECSIFWVSSTGGKVMAHYRNIELNTPPEMTSDVQGTASFKVQETDWTQLSDCGLTSDCVTLFKTYRESQAYHPQN